MSAAEVVCGQVEAQCRCIAPPHDDGPHRCACGGSWHYAPDGDTVIDAYPGSAEDWPGPDSTQMDPLGSLAAWSREKERQLIQQMRTPESDQSGEDGEQPAPPFMGMLDPITAMIRLGAPIRAERGGIRFIRPPSSTPEKGATDD